MVASTCNKHLKIKLKSKLPSQFYFQSYTLSFLAHNASQLMYCHYITYRKQHKVTTAWQVAWYTLHFFQLKITQDMPYGLYSQCFDTILTTSAKMPCETWRSSKHYFRMHFHPRRKQCLSIKNSDKLTGVREVQRQCVTMLSSEQSSLWFLQ